jgi:hypothetical protein
VPGSAAPIAAVGGCWPVAAVPPAVGPAPASREASSFVILSISVVHGPAQAAPGRITIAQAPNSNVAVFMALSRLRLRTAAWNCVVQCVNRQGDQTFRRDAKTIFACFRRSQGKRVGWWRPSLAPSEATSRLSGFREDSVQIGLLCRASVANAPRWQGRSRRLSPKTMATKIPVHLGGSDEGRLSDCQNADPSAEYSTRAALGLAPQPLEHGQAVVVADHAAPSIRKRAHPRGGGPRKFVDNAGSSHVRCG